jgi:hypothetical protein
LAPLDLAAFNPSRTNALKAATLSAAALAIPIAFLAKDQIDCGVLRGEQTIMIAWFGMIVAALFVIGDSANHITFGSVPLGPFVILTLLALILRRAFYHSRQPVFA